MTALIRMRIIMEDIAEVLIWQLAAMQKGDLVTKITAYESISGGYKQGAL